MPRGTRHAVICSVLAAIVAAPSFAADAHESWLGVPTQAIRVHLTSNPPGATVYHSVSMGARVEIGTTARPCTFEIQPGRHFFAFELDGHRMVHVDRTFRSGDYDLAAHLVPCTSTLVLVGVPERCTLSLGGRPTVIPVDGRLELQPGRHEASFRWVDCDRRSNRRRTGVIERTVYLEDGASGTLDIAGEVAMFRASPWDPPLEPSPAKSLLATRRSAVFTSRLRSGSPRPADLFTNDATDPTTPRNFATRLTDLRTQVDFFTARRWPSPVSKLDVDILSSLGQVNLRKACNRLDDYRGRMVSAYENRPSILDRLRRPGEP